ncbi:MAG: ethylbenzene dehydrogenase-related protein [Candidatus Jettenia sp. CY-1]|nr:MAG: ethylbenzene dehydrogenase-related protein [Candidatus Jettenia sp. CY-1]
MKKKIRNNYILFIKYGVLLLSVIFLGAILFAAEGMTPGVKGISEEELIPAKEVLTVKYVQIRKSSRIDVGSLKGAFKNAKGVKIALQKQDKAFPYGGGSIKGAEIRAIHDGSTIYFRISWKDLIKNTRVIDAQEFRDAVALMFPLGVENITPAEHFSPRMGDREKPVNLWHWKADWEVDLLVKDELKGMEERYPNMYDDLYSNPCSSYDHQELISSVEHVSGGRAAHNLLSELMRGIVVEDLNAEGFGTLTTQEHQDVNGCSKYKNGVWTVIMYRSLITKNHDDIQFVPGGKTYFNIAIWDGGKEDRNGQKNLSIQWHPILLEQVAYP